MKKTILAIFGLALIFTSCDLLEEGTSGLSDDEIVNGLKTALAVGADSSSSGLSAVNGYLGDPLVKIPLPEEAEFIRNLINNNNTLAPISATLGLDDKFEDVILAVNRAAEDAARDAAPIFKDAITDLNISQGLDILNGKVPSDAVAMKNSDFDSTAATQYLKGQTFNPLTNLYAPKINTSLGKPLVGNISPTSIWEDFTSTYNKFLSYKVNVGFLSYSVEQYSNDFMKTPLPGAINTDLGEFSTQKALDGLFFKVGETEKNIRRDPWQWISTTVGNILTKIFGKD